MKIKNFIAAAAAASLIFACLSGCSGLFSQEEIDQLFESPSPSQPSGNIILPSGVAFSELFQLGYTPGERMNPYTDTDSLNRQIYPLMYEGLFSINQKFEAENSLCSLAYPDDSGLLWTFVLDTGRYFSDFTPVTAYDAVYSLRQAMREGSVYAERLKNIESIKRADDYSFTVKLAAPNADFCKLLDVPIVKEDTAGDVNPIGSGPYTLISDGTGGYLYYNENWWQEREVAIYRIELTEVGGKSELVSAFATGRVSIVSYDPTGTYASGYNGNYETRTYDTPVMQYLGYNSLSPLAAVPEFRIALTRAIDREHICSDIYGSMASPAVLPLSPAAEDYPALYQRSWLYSAHELSHTLAQLGYSDLNGDGMLDYREGRRTYPLTVRLLVNEENSRRTAAARYIADILTQSGVAVELKVLKWSSYISALKAGEFDIYCGEIKLGADFDISSLITAEGSLNYGLYSDPELELANSAYMAGGEYSAFAESFLQRCPFTVLLFKKENLLSAWGKVEGLQPVYSDIFRGIESWKVKGY